ncbi:CoA pyrophosphatase [Novosphingobium bradum]|uniref:CoA pyrophosphatase n=1 Tax=Novosphingobium bradum TaxID=1737444 RepID=A0ABV7IRD8_9SPHN
MSALFSRLLDLHEAGHARTDIELAGDHGHPAGTVLRDAAVLVAITERAEPGVLLIHRPSNMRAHPGQVAFPGGKLDPGESPVEAALREAHEELGIPPEAVRIVGESDLFRTRTGYAITPVIGVVPADLELVPNPTEVAQWFEAPLDHVFNPANQKRATRDFPKGSATFWEIFWQEHRIWGVTGALMVNLSRRLGWHG